MLDERKLKSIVKEKEAYLNLLEELDRTGQLRKVNYKTRVNFTIDEQLINEFKKYCETNHIKMSNAVEEMIKNKIAK